jgi:hypothetical protein
VDGRPAISSRTAELFNQGLDFFTADLTRPMESPLGHTVADALAIPVIDLYVHAWDLAATINLVIEIPGTVIAYAHDHLDQVPEEIIRGGEPGIRTRGTSTRRHNSYRRIPRLDRPSVTLSVRGSAAG